ncbi:MAG: FxsA family protein [Nocardioides sp.]|uniref:FxsA family protein n=1 Tax=Nocardioides sp. TaxID=35761 RepID=UPI0039E40AE8
MRRRTPWSVALMVAFLVVPLLEIYVLIQVGQVIGAGWTVLLLLADAVFGSWLIKHEGARAWATLRTALSEGRMPHRELADGALVVLGGALMISPGFVSDVLGILLVVPVTRPFFRRLLGAILARRFLTGGPRPPDDVIKGEVVDRS